MFLALLPRFIISTKFTFVAGNSVLYLRVMEYAASFSPRVRLGSLACALLPAAGVDN